MSSSAKTASATASAPDTFFSASLAEADPEIANAIKGELNDAELELVSAGAGDDCAAVKRSFEGVGDTIRDTFTGKQPDDGN